MPDPLYSAENCKAAYQLRWSLALFADKPIPDPTSWHKHLQQSVEKDSVRILDVKRLSGMTWLFLLSSQLQVIPNQIVKSVKGRLQNAIHETAPSVLRRNFRLTSIGDANLEAVEGYVATQLSHHVMATERAQKTLAEFQLIFPDVDLSVPVNSAHGQYVLAAHVALVNAERWKNVDRERLVALRDVILRTAAKHNHRISRLSLLADHAHFTLGLPYDKSPESVVMSYMNNIAYVHRMTAILQSSYYIGTIGRYDMNAVRS